ncbi:MAG TPA: tRNA (adenosine(37)-N6)-threonylcarbamoyltransferase complex dimerization subunit type 1 TsaB [Acidimicrobiales bacterium]|nr:tRNA (adenosine(37)-N6)-threonylcarbamoyltransferase complex dimerization subunit type 1 TsaB [Acidimicrobiales bacterium]
MSSGDWTLGVATSTAQVGVALAGPDGVAAEIRLMAGRRHAETLAPAIQSATRLAGVDLGAVRRVAVDAGPGLFTGLRVGVATAKAIASALGVPVVPCTSLELLAHPHRLSGRTVAAVVDARRGQLFWALYRPGADGMVALGEPAVADPAEVAAELARLPEPPLVTGDGARRYLPEADLAPEEMDHPSPVALLLVAAGRAELPPEKVSPVYLRGPDVRIGWEQRP